MSPPAKAFWVRVSSAVMTSTWLTTPGSSGLVYLLCSVSSCTSLLADTSLADTVVLSGGQPEPRAHATDWLCLKNQAKNVSAAAFLAGLAWLVTPAVTPMPDSATP